MEARPLTAPKVAPHHMNAAIQATLTFVGGFILEPAPMGEQVTVAQCGQDLLIEKAHHFKAPDLIHRDYPQSAVTGLRQRDRTLERRRALHSG